MSDKDNLINEYYKSLFKYSLDTVFILDTNGNFIEVSPAIEKLSGFTADRFIKKPFMQFITPPDLQKTLYHFHKALNSKAQSFNTSMSHKDGYRVELSVNIAPVFVENTITGVIGIAKDITESKRMEDALRESKEQYHKLVEFLPDALFVHRKGEILFANQAAADLLGVSKPADITGRSLFVFLLPEYHKAAEDRLSQIQDQRKTIPLAEQRYMRADGTIIDVEVSGTYITYQGKPAIQSVVRDITERKKAEREISYLAHHDSLTGLPNRNFFNSHLNMSLKRSDLKNRNICIMFIDLDRFKIINDTMGHTFGDAFLKQISERLNQCVRKGDIVSRYGGDEFIIMMEDISSIEASEAAGRIISEFSHPFMVNGCEVFITSSIGISFYPDDGQDIDTIVKNADMAMYYAKEQGKNNYQFYSFFKDLTFSKSI